jgi:general secretion pathway protein D
VNPSTKSVSNNETFTLDVEIEGVSDLYGSQLDVGYNQSILEFNGLSHGTFLNRNGQDQTFCVDYENETAGLVRNIACTRLREGSVGGKGVLATISFKAIGAGTSKITLSTVKLANSKIDKLNSSISNGEVIVS